eukprot:12416941-Prorocentrum_lima.AAC.1
MTSSLVGSEMCIRDRLTVNSQHDVDVCRWHIGNFALRRPLQGGPHKVTKAFTKGRDLSA